MQRNLTERSIGGCLPVPLFNQKKRSRIPLTSNPFENEFGSRNEYFSAQSVPVLSLPPGILGNSGYSQVPRSTQLMPTVQNSEWSTQDYFKKSPLGNTAGRGFTSDAHKGYPGHIGSQLGKQSQVSWQDRSRQPNTTQNSIPSSKSAVGSWRPSYLHLWRDQQPCRPLNISADLHSQNLGSDTPLPGSQQQSSMWQFKSTSQSSPFKRQHEDAFPKKKTPQKLESQAKPVMENSMHILTAVIQGMKHWSQYKDGVSFLFEIFATLDSAVTIGNHGAKTFLLRDGRDVVQCVFYETDQDLPRLIRGQVHRCVGKYDRTTDMLTCMSVRQASSSEQSYAQEAVKASDAEMRRLVRSLREQ